jgi:hypothetical protein
MFAFHKPVLAICILIGTGFLDAGAQSMDNSPAGTTGLDTYIKVKHGLDQELINGVQYYNRYRSIMNHPYFRGEEPFPGSVTLCGKKYDDLQISYDLYAQWLVLQYRGLHGGINQIILNPVRIDAFKLDGIPFEKLDLDERGELFYQVIRAGGLVCYVHWEIQILETFDNLEYPEYFSDPGHYCYLELEDALYPFTSKRKLLSLFPGGHRKRIKKYMWQENIRFSKATPGQLTGLMDFISAIRTSSPQN